MEVSKGGATDKSYFYKQEVLLHFEHYVDRLIPIGSEPIDLGHNNPDGKFAKRKEHFTQMNIYKLVINGYEYTVKTGVYKSGRLNLYSLIDIKKE